MPRMTSDATAARGQVLNSPEPQVVSKYREIVEGREIRWDVQERKFSLCLASPWVLEFRIVTDRAALPLVSRKGKVGALTPSLPLS